MPSWGTTGGAAGEWYWWRLRGGQGYGPTGCGGKLGGPMGTCKPNPAYGSFHNKTFGADFKYSEFGPMFTAELFDPEAWAALFAASGIKYVVLTSKHHEGWTNWCSKEAWNWNACDNGPHRDLVGELSQSVRAAGMHMGLYHSIFEFYHPLYLEDKANNFTTSRYVDEVYIPQSKELNQLYKPDLIWSDGDWEANSSCALLALTVARLYSVRMICLGSNSLLFSVCRNASADSSHHFICPHTGPLARRLEINRAACMDVQRRPKPRYSSSQRSMGR